MRSFLVLLLLAVAVGVWSKEEATYGPRDVEVHMRDGSRLRGELSSDDAFDLQTPYGTLQFPPYRLLRLQLAARSNPVDGAAIGETIKELDSDTLNVRQEAQRKLEALGAAALPTLQEARQTASAEVRSRIDALLKKLAAAGVPARTEDEVTSDEFACKGKLLQESFGLKNHFGLLTIKFLDVETVIWLARGETVKVSLDASSSLGEWIDTGLDTIPNAQLVIKCGGTINLFSNGEVPPTGSGNFGRMKFMYGAVIGRLGATGAPFLVGQGKTLNPTTRERLYLCIYVPENAAQNNGNPSSGEFLATVATGFYAEDAKAPEAPAPNNPRRYGRMLRQFANPVE